MTEERAERMCEELSAEACETVCEAVTAENGAEDALDAAAEPAEDTHGDDGGEARETATGELCGTSGVSMSGDIGDLTGDLPELIGAFPELYGVERLEEVPKYARYRGFRAQGLTPKEAYYASNGEEIIKRRMEADRRRELRSQTLHLTSVIGQSEVSERVMSESEKRAARIALGYSATDAELERLWKRIYSGGESNH